VRSGDEEPLGCSGIPANDSGDSDFQAGTGGSKAGPGLHGPGMALVGIGGGM
jgi:hypothetical protein